MLFEVKVVVDPVCIAHKLNLPYKSKCNKLHGHGYKVEATLGTHNLDANGMVLDFTKLKEVIMQFDHTFLGKAPSGTTPEMLEALGVELASKSTEVEPSTAENFARTLFIELQKATYGTPAQLGHVTVWETPNNSVTVSDR